MLLTGLLEFAVDVVVLEHVCVHSPHLQNIDDVPDVVACDSSLGFRV
jgi:hypothetical protein